ncbi:MAG: Gfo/Idh/MocA family oxidoreductase [Chloroflexota bacterium]|nr:Gfo/Idh/MocA family oxidoreductase [Chloroflexota bacterium]
MSVTDQPLRVAILGDGPLARPMLDALTDRTPGARVVAVATEGSTPNPSAITRAMGAEAVCVAAPVADRAALIVAALEAGVPVCCPVPVAGDLSTLDSLILRAADAGVMVYAPNPLRHWLPLATMHARRKSIGAPISLFAAHRTTRAIAGDLFTDLALPLIDAALWLVEAEVERVQVMAERLFTDGPGEGPDRADAALIVLRFANGVVATLEVARSLPDDFPQAEEVSVEFLGRDAVLRANPTNQAITITGAHGTTREDWLPHPAISIMNTFVETIRTGATAPQSLLDARWVLPVLEKVRLAAATSEMVRVGGALRR